MAKLDSMPNGPNANPPRVYIDVAKKDLDEIDGLDPGDGVTVVIKGKLVSLNKSKDEDGARGSICVEGYKLGIKGASDDFAALVDDDE